MSLFDRSRRERSRTRRSGSTAATPAPGAHAVAPHTRSRPDPKERDSTIQGEGSGWLSRSESGPNEPAGGIGNQVATIGKSIVFKGDLTGDEDLQIDGNVEGGIQLANHQLTVGETGRVQAQLFAKSVVVIGQVVGNVTATERVEVQASGTVEGDIHTPRLLVAEGAVLNGAVEMTLDPAHAETGLASPGAGDADPEAGL